MTRNIYYNGNNKVVAIWQNGDIIAKFEYNIDGQISKAIYGDKVEEFMWDGLALIWRSGVTYINEPYVTGGNPVMAENDVLFNDMLGNTLAVNGNPVEMTSFGETADKNAFFTGKPMVDELGYTFLFRNYRSDYGKWQTTDPLGYPDGWNNLAYCNNEVVGFIDYMGKFMIATYSISKHQFSYQLSINGTIYRGMTIQVFSGDGDHRNKPESENVAGAGPIPLGEYYVIQRESGGTLGWLYDLLTGKDTWFALLADDGKIDDYTSVDGVNRGEFRMHPGSKSFGCITFSNNQWYDDWRNLVLQTSTQKISGTDIFAYGKVRVIE